MSNKEYLALALFALALTSAYDWLLDQRAKPQPAPPAIEARLLGQCGGRILAGLEEDSFPAGCDWIEPINYKGEEK